MSQIRHPNDIIAASAAMSTSSSTSNIAKAFVEVIAASGTVIADIAKAAVTHNWTTEDQQNLLNLIQTPGWKAMQPLLSPFESIALVVGGEGGLIFAGKGMGGVIFEPSKPTAPHYYLSVGISVGGTEGAEGITGIVLNKEDIHHAGGSEAFFSVQADLGVGVAAETFHDLFGKNDGFVVLVTGGEEIDVSSGLGYTVIKDL